MFEPKAGTSQIDYQLCRYGKSTLLFRGPRQRTDLPYVAYLGGTETYGKNVAKPFPELVGAELGIPAINLGCVGGGITLFANEPELLRLCARSKATVIQVPPALSVSNRFFSVKHRQNANVAAIDPVLEVLYKGVDLNGTTKVHDLLQLLSATSPDRFSLVKEELGEVWQTRMRALIQQIGGAVILLWFGPTAPEDSENFSLANPHPMFVNREMLESLRSDVSAIVEISTYGDDISQDAHEEAAFTLSPTLERILAQT